MVFRNRKLRRGLRQAVYLCLRLSIRFLHVIVLGEERTRHGKPLDLVPVREILVATLQGDCMRIFVSSIIQPLQRLADILPVPVRVAFLLGQLLQSYA